MIESILSGIVGDYGPYILLAVAVGEPILHFIDNATPGSLRDRSTPARIAFWVIRFAKRYLTPGGIGRTAAGIVKPSSATARNDDFSIPTM